MPRSATKEQQRVSQAVSARLEQWDLQQDGRLSLSAISRALRISRTTLRKYGIDRDVAEATRRLRGRSRTDGRIAALQSDVALWKARYEGVLEKLVRLEFHLRQHPAIDVDALLDKPILRALRALPPLQRKKNGIL